MVEVPLAWKISQTGAESVKARFQELRQEYEKGNISQEQYTKNMKQLRKEANDLNETTRTQSAIFKATHQSLVAFGRVMSTVTSVMHAGVSAVNAVNIASIALSGQNTSVAQATAEVEKAQRAYNDAVKLFGEDSPQAKNAASDLNTAYADLAEKQKQASDQIVNSGIAVATSIGLIASSTISAIPQIATLVPALGSLRIAFLGLNLSLGVIGLIAAGIAIAAILIIENWEPISKFFNDFGIQLASFGVQYVFPFVSAVTGAFQSMAETLGAVWQVVRTAFLGFWNGMIGIVNAGVANIVAGIEALANGFVMAINGMIAAVNALRGVVGLSKINPIAKISLAAPQIPLIAAANGFQGMINSPTLFLAGEAGPEAVNIAPAANSVTTNNSFAGSGGNTYITIQGSLLRERDLYQTVSQYQKRELLRRNFRPV